MNKLSWKEFIKTLPNNFTAAQYRQLEEGNAECERLFKEFFLICKECSLRKSWDKDKPYPEECWSCIEKQTNVINDITDKKFPFYQGFVTGDY